MSQDYGDIQHKRGDTAKNDAHTGPSGAFSVDLQANNVRVHDGVTPGGLFSLKSADDTDQAIAAVVDGAPSALDTLRKIAEAINNDAAFHQTIQGLLNLKLNSAAYTAADVLAKLKTVDGHGSGLDADTLDGKQLATLQSEYQNYANQAVADLIDSSPDALNTLNELAAALGDDPNFAATMTTALGKKVDKVTGKGLSTNDYTTTEKNKLAGIAAGAQVNVPTNLGIAGSGDSRQITSSTGSNVTLPVASTTNAGLMSTNDKSKLDGIEAGAQANPTSNETLAAIKAVDGSGSGLDADLLDGQHGSYYYSPSNPPPAQTFGRWVLVEEGTDSFNVANGRRVFAGTILTNTPISAGRTFDKSLYRVSLYTGGSVNTGSPETMWWSADGDIVPRQYWSGSKIAIDVYASGEGLQASSLNLVWKLYRWTQ